MGDWLLILVRVFKSVSTYQPGIKWKGKNMNLITQFFQQALKEALVQIRVCSRLEGLLLKKKFLNSGDSPEVHAQKVCFSLTVELFLCYIF